MKILTPQEIKDSITKNTTTIELWKRILLWKCKEEILLFTDGIEGGFTFCPYSEHDYYKTDTTFCFFKIHLDMDEFTGLENETIALILNRHNDFFEELEQNYNEWKNNYK